MFVLSPITLEPNLEEKIKLNIFFFQKLIFKNYYTKLMLDVIATASPFGAINDVCAVPLSVTKLVEP